MLTSNLWLLADCVLSFGGNCGRELGNWDVIIRLAVDSNVAGGARML